ncbi:MAG: hypothetical protein JXL84_04745 [Deltaproteobacteria bacterium]|nr:hypothetical protein [Deltaproteobacteria bacterium]
MDQQTISLPNRVEVARGGRFIPVTRGGGSDFRTFLVSSAAAQPPTPPETSPPQAAASLPGIFPGPPAITSPTLSRNDAITAYRKYETRAAPTAGMSDVEKYKDDQLLIHPGGDHYDLDQKKVVQDPPEQKSFWGRIKKDLSDAFSNVKNFFDDLLFGAKFHYRDKDGQIREGRRRGLLGSVVDFFKDLGSALSFGTWRPDGEEEPQGFLKRVGFFFSKMKEAVFGDVIQGMAGSVIHMAKDLLFAAWNTLEVIPDATIGNLDAGRKATTAIFDHGQVALDYMTDIVPGGDAWVRVHSLDIANLKAPLQQNLEKPERSDDDERWRYVRNTPFRKTIETIGSLLMDILTIKVLGHSKISSDERKG